MTPSTLARNSATALVAKLSAMALATAGYAIIARLLSVEQVGQYFIIISVAQIAGVAATLGVSTISVRFIAGHLALHEEPIAVGAIKKASALVITGTLVATLALASPIGNLLWRSLVPGVTGIALLLATLIVAIRAWEHHVTETLRGLSDIPSAVSIRPAIEALLIAGLLALLWGARGDAGLVTILVVLGVAHLPLLAWGTLRISRAVQGVARPDVFKASHLLKVSWPVASNAVLEAARAQIPLWIFGFFGQSESAAFYAVGWKLSVLVGLPIFVVNAVVPPLIASKYAQGHNAELEAVLRKMATLLTLPSLATLTGFALVGAPFLGGVFGDAYRAALPALLVLSMGELVNVATGSCGTVLLMTGHERTNLRVQIVVCLGAALASLALIQVFGLVGAAAGVALATGGQSLVLLRLARIRAGVRTGASPYYLRSLVRLGPRRSVASLWAALRNPADTGER